MPRASTSTAISKSGGSCVCVCVSVDLHVRALCTWLNTVKRIHTIYSFICFKLLTEKYGRFSLLYIKANMHIITRIYQTKGEVNKIILNRNVCDVEHFGCTHHAPKGVMDADCMCDCRSGDGRPAGVCCFDSDARCAGSAVPTVVPRRPQDGYCPGIPSLPHPKGKSTDLTLKNTHTFLVIMLEEEKCRQDNY